MKPETTDQLVAQLDSPDAAERRSALEQLAAARPHAQPPRRPEINLHCHTFFSYNAYGYSPSRFAWEAWDYGLEVAGIVDFDVLDGVVEFLEAGRLLGLKTVAGFETRVFIREYSDKVINSPHEPGVCYLAGVGFTAPPETDTEAARVLASMAACARRRNTRMLDRINEHLDPVSVDYEQDVLPLTPAGNATERHMLVAYERAAREALPAPDDLTAFWAEKLDEPIKKVRGLPNDAVALKNLIRGRLMKHGGVGYAAPDEGSFPALEDVVEMTLACGSVPSGCWLDGTNPGEADPLEHFAFFRSKGIPTITIIPDRNWNLRDSDERALKVGNLHRALEAAAQLQLPVLVGTEMNKAGQKFVDTFAAPEMEPYRQSFLDGAHVAWGHTLLKMTAGVGLTGDWADRHFGGDARARNEFFRRIGEAPYPNADAMSALAATGPDTDPVTLSRLVQA